MQKTISLKLLPSEALEPSKILRDAAKSLGVATKEISSYHIVKKSIDARGRQPWVQISVEVFVGEPAPIRKAFELDLKDVSRAEKTAIVVGSGPAGLFASLRLLEAGIRPIVLERGKDVRNRRRDLAQLNKYGILNPDSNYCFGEGGAGTYSDGKLYTRSSKRGDLRRILNIFVKFGADESILYESHPHIGTNKLPLIITNIRNQILSCGGLFLFNQKVIDFTVERNRIKRVHCASKDHFDADAVILATGHSARDIFHLLHHKNIAIESKPFALGVRIEHPQSLIDSIQYHLNTPLTDRVTPTPMRPVDLPPASYSLVSQEAGRGVFSFCMCPGGIIAPASTDQGELVVNGWSPSKRNNPFANSGIVVSIAQEDLEPYHKKGPLAGIYFQQSVEKKAFHAGGGLFVAPGQRMADFLEGKTSSTLPECSYLPGVTSCSLQDVLPDFVYEGLSKGLRSFGKKMKGYLTNEAILVATESRTSSPVRIPRDPDSSAHPQISNLYPCGEGAGYAGGIVSAAMDGELVAKMVATQLRNAAGR